VDNINYLPPLSKSDHSILYFACDRYPVYKRLVQNFAYQKVVTLQDEVVHMGCVECA